jgi:hypothetical protein
MNKVREFYLKQAIYQVKIGNNEVTLLMNYSANEYEIVGNKSKKIADIAKSLLSKKHGVNFAYKFNAKMGEDNL